MFAFRTFSKTTVAALIALSTASTAFAATSSSRFSVGQPETILVPSPQAFGCWTDEGNGRISSCDAG